jgi:serine/threonine protein kinase
VCDTMAYVHTRGVIHRDLKPQNIRVGDFGEVFVMDWGLAKELAAEDPPQSTPELPTKSNESMAGDARGTPPYMSPEQALGDGVDVGPATDIYAVGAMLYELIADTRPYEKRGESSTNKIVLERLKLGPPEPLIRLAKRAPPELISICEKAMARESRTRYRDMRELAEDLRAHLEVRIVRAHAFGMWARGKKWVQRNKALAAALVCVALLMGGGAALYARNGVRRRSVVSGATS